MCKMMALWAIHRGFGLSFLMLLGFKESLLRSFATYPRTLKK